MKKSKRGFTLIELLVVVLIIGILAAVALPQYKHAVLKSRFNTVMPMAKSIADAQEVYFLSRQMYALSADELDVTPATAENTTVTLSQLDEHNYVMAQNSKVPGAHYIIYQKYSENYPSEIHCEAEDENADAQWLCGVLSNNNSIGKTITDGYTTYVINGTGAGFPPGYSALLAKISCDKAEAMGYTCEPILNDDDTATKRVCNSSFCLVTTFNEDGTYTRASCKKTGSVCNTQAIMKYDENGNVISKRVCSTGTDGQCSEYSSVVSYDFEYDQWGNITKTRYCAQSDADGVCTRYGNVNLGVNNYTYDAQGKLVSAQMCSTVDSCTDWIVATRNADGNPVAIRPCNQVSADGTSCESWDYYSTPHFITYDNKGNVASGIPCDTPAADYTSCKKPRGPLYYYTYDDNNKLIGVRQKNCNNGTCSWNTDAFSARSYFYDEEGHFIGQGYCSSAQASCSQTTSYVLDDEGKPMYYNYGSNLSSADGGISHTVDTVEYGSKLIVPLLNKHI